MGPRLNFSCQCGVVKGEINHTDILYGNHFVCMCDDCQTYAHHLGKANEFLDSNGGTDILPVHPAYLKFTSGIEKMRCLKLRENGLFRWYADCCKSPITNSMSGKFGYYGFLVNAITTKDKELGPVKARLMGKFGIPPLPEGTHQTVPPKFFGFILKSIFRMILKGLRTPNPLFDSKTFEPIVKPYILTNDELIRAQSKLTVRA